MKAVLCSLFLLLVNAEAERLVLVAGGPEFPLREPFGVEFTPAGEMVIAEMVSSNRLLKMDGAGRVTALAANGKGYAGDGGPVAQAQFNGMHNLAIAPNGDLYLADTWNYRVRKVEAQTGLITTIAGTGRKGFGGDGGPATAADFSSIIQIALAVAPSPRSALLYVTDIENRRIRRIDLATGVVTTVAGNGSKGVPADGAAAKDAPLVDPRAVAPAADGSFYILERGGHALRFVDAAGKIRTVAGTGKAGASGDGGSALAATFNGPKHLCLDSAGRVLIADAENHLIRRYDPRTGQIERIAGTGQAGSAGLDGPPLAAQLNRPHGVTFHPDGTLYITDSYNDRVLKMVP